MSDYRQQQEQQEQQEWIATARHEEWIFCPYCGEELRDRSQQCCGEVHGATIDEIGEDFFK